MNPSGSSSSPRNLIGAEAHPEDPHNIADNIRRFVSGGFEGMAWSGRQYQGPQVESALIGIPFERTTTTVVYPLSMPPTPSSAPLEELHPMHLSYATAHDQYAGHGLPAVDGFRQGFMDDWYDHPSQSSLGEQWPIIPEDDFMMNLEQGKVVDAATYWEPQSIAGDQHPGSDVMMDIIPTTQTPNGGPLIFICQHYTGDRPCAMWIDGDIQHALEHFSRVHVQPEFATSGPPWNCRWGGECGTPPLCKGSWRRHVMKHLVRWQCSNCSQIYSRDDSARKHAKKCGGNGHIFMVPLVGDHPAST